MNCVSCDGAGKRGVFGRKGLGLVSSRCKHCDGTGGRSTRGVSNTDLASADAVDSAPPVIAAPPIFLEAAELAQSLPDTPACDVRSDASRSFFTEVAYLPSGVPEAAPLYSHHLMSMTLADVRSKLEADDWVMDEFLCTTLSPCYELETEPFVKSTRFPGMLLRRTRCMKEMPKKVPTAFAKLLGVPEVSKVTSVWHLDVQQNEIRLFGQSCSHDMMYSDRFRAQQVHVYRPLPSGGVEFRFWAKFAVFKSMPMGFGMFKGIADSQTEGEFIAGIPHLMTVLCNTPTPVDGVLPQAVGRKGRCDAGKCPHHAAPTLLEQPAPWIEKTGEVSKRTLATVAPAPVPVATGSRFDMNRALLRVSFLFLLVAFVRMCRSKLPNLVTQVAFRRRRN